MLVDLVPKTFPPSCRQTRQNCFIRSLLCARNTMVGFISNVKYDSSCFSLEFNFVLQWNSRSCVKTKLGQTSTRLNKKVSNMENIHLVQGQPFNLLSQEDIMKYLYWQYLTKRYCNLYLILPDSNWEHLKTRRSRPRW